MPSYKLQEFDGITDSESAVNSTTTLYRKNNGNGSGCYVSVVHGFILTFLAIAIAAMVGVIVVFAGNNQETVCNCQTSDSNPNNDGQVQCPPATTPAPVPCPDITCPVCPTPTTPPIVSTTSPSMASTSMAPTTMKTTGMPTTAMTTTSISNTTTTTTESQPEVVNTRLPTSLTPLEYDVVLRPDIFASSPELFKTPGSVKIKLYCNEGTDNITIHIYMINVLNNTIRVTDINNGGTEIAVTGVSENVQLNFYIIHLETSLEIGKHYFVEMQFVSALLPDNYGLYYSSFQRDGKPVYLAFTQFQPTDARKAFPCFDEPALKAIFNITLERKPVPGYRTLSNMPKIGEYNTTDGWIADVYETSVKMPTYLLAFAVVDFSYKETITRNGTLFRSFARDEDYHRLNFSVDIGSRMLEDFETYFDGLLYPLPKLDMIVDPNFGFAGMENWGLIIYAPEYMLYDPVTTTPTQQKYVAEVIAHELAHMWFGNKITPKWWDDLWLNEGFAMFLSYIGMDLAEPSWNILDHTTIDILYLAFASDSLPSSRPIFSHPEDIQYPDQINNLFDDITYLKAGSILRMMWHFIGPETFRLGLTRLVRENIYDSVIHNDLWDVFSNETLDGGNLDVKGIMDTWILQRNYPVIHVSRDGNNIKVTQNRFVIGNVSGDVTYAWNVPFTYTSSNEMNFDKTNNEIEWIHKTQPEKTISNGLLPDASDPDGWIIGNVQQYGYYRVNYDPPNWQAIINQLKRNHTVIHTANRAQIMNDMWAFVSADLVLDISLAMGVFDYLSAEKNFVPWYTALSELYDIDIKLRTRDAYGYFQTFMRNRLRDIFNTIGLVSNGTESMDTRLLRSSISQMACRYHLEECITQSMNLFNAWIADPKNIINPDIMDTVYCTGIQESSSDVWDIVFSRYENSTGSEQEMIRKALACSTEHWVLNRYLAYALDTTKIRKSNAVRVIRAVASNPLGQYTAWKFVFSQWHYIVNDYQMSSWNLNYLVEGITKGFFTEFERRQVQFLKSEHPADGPYVYYFDIAIERINNNIHWEDKHYNNLRDWLQMNSNP